MEEKFNEAKLILEKYNQEHLLYFYNELNNFQKEKLLDEILKTNFDSIKKMYEDSFLDDSIDKSRISPMDGINYDNLSEYEIQKYSAIGAEIITNNELAVITLAGGQGTRLGYKGPKGCFGLMVKKGVKKSLFEFLCDKLKFTYEKYGVYLNWYIMTSDSNYEMTKIFFEKEDYFGYPKDKVFFFIQDKLPIVNKEGKIILDSIYSLKESSNGNGDVFRAFKESNLLSTLLNKKYISISGVDNIILEIVDPVLIGIAESRKSDITCKSVNKENLSGKEWIFAKVDNKPDIVDSNYLDEEMRYSKNSKGEYNYNQINILSHLFTIDAFMKAIDIELRYHRAFKKNDYVNDEGMKIVATELNSFEFEKFIFDVFKYYDNFSLVQVKKENEFAPIKSFKGENTPERALDMYLNKINNH